MISKKEAQKIRDGRPKTKAKKPKQIMDKDTGRRIRSEFHSPSCIPEIEAPVPGTNQVDVYKRTGERTKYGFLYVYENTRDFKSQKPEPEKGKDK